MMGEYYLNLLTNDSTAKVKIVTCVLRVTIKHHHND